MSSLITRPHMTRMGLFSQFAAVTVVESTDEKSFTSTNAADYIGSMTLPPNFWNHKGQYLELMVMGGWLKNNVNAGLTLRVRMKIDGTSTILHTKAFTSQQLGTTSQLGHWQVSTHTTCRAVGASGSLMMHGMLTILENKGPERDAEHSEHGLFTMNTNLAQEISVTAQWGASSANASITADNFMMHQMDI